MAIARSLLQAVQFLHLNGYAHQDIHAANVFALNARNELNPGDTNATQFRLGDLGVAEILPSLALELEQLLKNPGEAELAAQVPQLVVVDRCRCGDDFCSSFYTQPKPQGHYGPGHRCLDLDAAEGMLLVDVVEGKIAQVEILNRLDVRHKLLTALP